MKKMSKYARERLQYKNKPRKVLSLEERVQALRMFDHTPVYQRVATAFGCSWEQIKNVVLSREEILNYYARCQTIQPDEHPSQIRKKKIIFLGNAVFEFIKRATYHKNLPLDEDEIRARALEFRNAIEIDQFYPNNAWLSDFKRVFNIDFPNPDNIVFTQTPAKSLDCHDIIEYCREEIKNLLVEKSSETVIEAKSGKTKSSTLVKAKKQNGIRSKTNQARPNEETTCKDDQEDDDNDDDDDDGDGNGNGDDDDDDTADDDEDGLTIDFSHYEYNDTAASSPLNKGNAIAGKRSLDAIDSSSMLTKRIKQERRSSTPTTCQAYQEKHTNKKEEKDEKNVKNNKTLNTQQKLYKRHSKTIATTIPPQILSSQSALAHLIPLQDYALGEEDFLAINLLANLAEHYRRDATNDTPHRECSSSKVDRPNIKDRGVSDVR